MEAIKHDRCTHPIFSVCLPATRADALKSAATEKTTARSMLVANHMLTSKAKVAKVTAATTPEQKVLRFVRLVQHLSTAPWASVYFEPNAKILNRMMASHLSLVTGLSKNPRSLYKLIDPSDSSLADSQNLVWITNRQQGKTTTVGRFLAAISLACLESGTCLACVYSTKLERAGELLMAAKQYLWWMQAEGKHPEWSNITFERDNANMFAVSVNGGPAHTVYARPKNPDTCRGDAFRLGLFDEVAFTSSQFWYTFAMPLMMVRGRVFTCTTTPPPAQTFFADFCKGVESNMAKGDMFFELINHSLACAACIANNDALRCVHRLANIPPWKPIMNLSSLAGLMPKNKAAEFAQEVYGKGFFVKRVSSCLLRRSCVLPVCNCF